MTEKRPISKENEHELQVKCVQWYRSVFPMGVIFEVPNAGRRNAATLKWMIQEGFVAGAPDLVAMRYDGKIVFIEMKTIKGRLRPGQVEFKQRCDYLDEELYFVCRSIEDFKNIIYYGKEEE